MYAVENRLKLWFTGVRHIRIELPKYVAFIIDKLYENGYEAFAVGGCVRDAVMGRIPHDWDITTNALPKQVKSIFNKTIDTGIKHGTVTVMLNRVGYEVTTYRIDGEYTDGRHPKEVVFTPNLTEDLRRRDFTINAMAYNDKTGIIDEFDGIEDIQNKVIRCVGVPEDRFNEDALRMLRAIRFSAQLDFSIDNDTYNAIGKLYKNLSLISKERIQTELTKIITSESPGRIKDICRLGLDRYVFGDNSVLSGVDISVYEKVSYIMEKLPDNSYLRYAGLLTYETDIENVLRGLKLDNKTINIVARLVYNKNKELSTNKADIRRAVVAIGEDIFSEYYLEYMKALIKVKHEGITLSLEDIDTISFRYQEIIADNECLKLNDMAVHGKDLKALGLPDGKLIGDILKILFDRVLENPQLNNKEILIEMAKKLI
ncbi:MAG: CCA tRNA nucleotidyltransferase [Lachnospiraceae bacterium]|nr:CCA tRNA nucleotidyltransferase [Lachnospiraceae bacterium]MDE6698244.1 CCA tRNA nucleotidyltransferase [Lachnospiraceae bacterium]